MNLSEDLMVQLRHVLHKHPELSGHERETAARIVGFLKSQRPTKIIEGLGGTGVAAVYQSSPSPTILVRCELDALPIREINQMEYRSEEPDVSHMCGHDGHMAIVAGLGSVLGGRRLGRGRVVLLFQPAEENGMGAKAILEDEKFKEIEPDYVLALHNIPGYPMHQVVCREGSFTAAVTSMIVKLHGKTAHAGEPHKGINPALAVAEILQNADRIQEPGGRKDFSLFTPIQVELGEEAYGISAGEAELKFTLRTWDSDSLDLLCAKADKMVRQVAQKHSLEVEVDWTQSFASNQNSSEIAAMVEKAARANDLDYVAKSEPFSWGEDFGLFTEKYPGAMFGLGAGEDTPALHNPDYDFPDELIPSGVSMFSTLIDMILESK